MDMTKMMIDAYMKPLYDLNPSGQLLANVQKFEDALYSFAAENPGAMDIVGESGKRDEYNALYIAAMTGGCQTPAPEEEVGTPPEGWTLPTVKEFLDSYRYVYESSVKPYNRPMTEAAYMRLFAVADRTDDLLEAQIIIEKE
jgi:hypothetical protein